MTDRFFALTVTLEHDVRDDDAAPLIAAIKQLRGVLDVEPHVADITSAMAESRAIMEVQNRLLEALRKRERK